MQRTLWHVAGWLALGLGILGAVLPVMPTVPFLLVAVWCFSHSSPELRDRILAHRHYGPPIRAWVERGAIAPKAKILAVVAMAGGVVMALILWLPGWIVALQTALCLGIGAYVLTRPAG